MEIKNRQRQFELFMNSNQSISSGQEYKNLIFQSINLTIENILLISIVIILGLVLSFSLGVEKGKALFSSKEPLILKKEAKIVTTNPMYNKTISKEIKQKPQESVKVTKTIPDTKQADIYTIQVASFTNESYAKKEAARLKDTGYEIQIIPKGKFVIVCVGSFLKRKEADASLNKLRKKYNDCIVRRL